MADEDAWDAVRAEIGFDPRNPDPAELVAPAAGQFVERLIERVPGLRASYDEHVADNSVLLPHVYFGDVTRWVVAEYLAQRPGWRAVLDVVEEEYAAGDDDVQEVIEQSFVENLPFPSEPGYGLERQLGPRLRAVHDLQRPS